MIRFPLSPDDPASPAEPAIYRTDPPSRLFDALLVIAVAAVLIVGLFVLAL